MDTQLKKYGWVGCWYLPCFILLTLITLIHLRKYIWYHHLKLRGLAAGDYRHKLHQEIISGSRYHNIDFFRCPTSMSRKSGGNKSCSQRQTCANVPLTVWENLYPAAIRSYLVCIYLKCASTECEHSAALRHNGELTSILSHLSFVRKCTF